MLKIHKHLYFLMGFLFLTLASTLCAKITVYMCGDSTMQDWNAGYYPKQGMGQDFSYFFNNAFVDVYNAGRGGTTSETYYNNHWTPVRNLIKSGDYVFIMFGANDNGYKTGEAVFVEKITAMVNETKSRGAYPILLSPIRRASFTNPDSIYESYHGYPIYMRNVAKATSVPLIDLDTLSRDLFINVGEYYAQHYFTMFLGAGEYSNYAANQSDNQHLQQTGANAMGRLVTEAIRNHSKIEVKTLANHLKPMYQVDVRVSPAGAAAHVSLSTYYPEGMTVTLKTTPKDGGPAFVGWFDGKGNKVSGNSSPAVKSSYIHTFVMKPASTQYTAVYAGGSSVLYTGNGAALAFDDSSSIAAPVQLKSFLDASAPNEIDIGFAESDHLGFMGKGYWNFNNALGSFASYNLNSPSAGFTLLAVVYANGGASDRRMNLNLGDHDYYVDFPPTGAWDNWDTVFVEVDMMNGEGVLRLTSMTADGGPNVDAFGFAMEGVQLLSTTSKSKRFEPRKAFSWDKGILTVPRSGWLQVHYFDALGHLALSQEILTHEGQNELRLSKHYLSAGFYQIQVLENGKTVLSSGFFHAP